MSSVPERLKGRVRLERLCQHLRTLGADAVVLETANEVEHAASEAVGVTAAHPQVRLTYLLTYLLSHIP